ncbi:AAA family ATPase [Pseudomonas putida]|uniref:ATPase AAA-type core domain-containing protein n=1 Tax=Pseudomonas putida (strain DOT-T1E) TaxID=1196325 RepID=I7B5G3_PSEPT|nr:AAA family ATPase [Pseudomonas putida]AFO50380.1 hypothetical protein T1E_4551 [Pseudomonas putida DOT-T1E]UZM95843.1 AAA family ATPase [Pseudomonas putida DOT-T1E]
MSLLDEIIVWAGGQKAWQQEALRRIFSHPELVQQDIDDLLDMVRGEEKEDSASKTVRPFSADDVPGAGSGATVRLAGVSGLDQINGFPSGRAFDLVPEGMTVLFGNNGAGKSGYARIFKNACKARHRVDVLPNAFEVVTPPRRPSAEFSILVEGVPETARWVQGEPGHPHLSSVSVYDSACANDYIDAEGTPAFQPYGLTHLTRLVLLQRDLQTRIGNERNLLILDARQFAALKGNSEVGRYIETLGANSDRNELTRLGTLADEELQRLQLLKRTLLETDPAPQAMALERLAARLDQAKSLAEIAQPWVNDRAIGRAKELITAEKAARIAMQLAQARLHGQGTSYSAEESSFGLDTDALLQGTGDPLWQNLYRAAEAFSIQQVYPNHAFPHVEPGSSCVLCQQPYSPDAAERMRRFANFISDSATEDAQKATDARITALRKVKTVNLDIIDTPTLSELSERLPDLHEKLSATTTAWTSRHAWLSKVLEEGDWDIESDQLPPEVNVDHELASTAATLRKDAATLRASADPIVRDALSHELGELEARQRLLDQLGNIERYIEESQTHAILSRCHAALNPAPVSRKLTILAGKYVTEALAGSMNAELKALGYKRRVQPDLSGRTDLGVTKVTLRLKDITTKASKVLSEGEQRALGMAMFLAELESLPHASTVIFDDPSTSLDHGYRRAIARRLVSLSCTRQILVFTHDAVFLTELAMALQRADRSASYKTIEWDESPGLVSDGLTWSTMDTKARLVDLKDRAKALSAWDDSYPNDALERHVSAAYSSLRGTIERATREVFLNNTVQPFSDVVSVEAFGAVIGHPEAEWDQVLAIYGKACEATEAHDTPGERQLALPSREELLGDIASIVELVGEATKRRSAFQRSRGERTEQRKKLFGA